MAASGALRVIPPERVSRVGKVVLAAEVVATYARVRWWLYRQNLPDIVGGIRRPEPVRDAGLEPGSLEARLVGGRLANAVYRTLRILPTDSRCLMQALVLLKLLAVRGLPGTLVIGAHSSPEFAAHAWIEHEGVPLQPTEQFLEARLLEL